MNTQINYYPRFHIFFFHFFIEGDTYSLTKCAIKSVSLNVCQRKWNSLLGIACQLLKEKKFLEIFTQALGFRNKGNSIHSSKPCCLEGILNTQAREIKMLSNCFFSLKADWKLSDLLYTTFKALYSTHRWIWKRLRLWKRDLFNIGPVMSCHHLYNHAGWKPSMNVLRRIRFRPRAGVSQPKSMRIAISNEPKMLN